MLKLVLDTNVVVSSLLSSGPPSIIVDLVAEGNIIPFYSDSILQEYWDVLSRKKFAFNPLQVSRLINDIARSGMAVECKQASKIKFADENDRIFYDAAIDAQAYLVTGNKKHFPRDSLIVSPAELLAI